MSPVHLSDEEFEAAVGDALDAIPGELADQMDNVVVLVRDEPEPELLTEADYDEDGLPTLLGLYDGVPLTERDDAWSVLERWCSNREELSAEIGVTVIHEIAHHFGIDDDRLHELGWE